MSSNQDTGKQDTLKQEAAGQDTEKRDAAKQTTETQETAEQGVDEQDAVELDTGDQAAADQETGDQAATEQETGDQSAAEQDAEKQIVAKQDAWWTRTRTLMLICMGIWFLAGLFIHLFVNRLNEFILFGFPFGYFMAAQGSLIIFVVLTFWYARRQHSIDRDCGVAEDEEAGVP